jgi:N,N'-diacetyllegionaminate synthase
MYFTSKINPVLFIAEVGSNHEGNFKEAKKLVINACNTDSDVVKLQIFTAENLVSKKYDNKRFEHFKKLELSTSQNKQLFKIIKSKKKRSSASIWDVEQVDLFKSFIDIYKIGSGDIHNFEIIKKIILLKKPLIISTGLSTVRDISITLSFIKSIDKRFIASGKLAILHCNTAYPTPKEDSYLGTIKYLKNKFKIDIGYSDHSVGDEVITYAYLLGSKIVEKHFSNTINKKSFRDHFISLNKDGVKKYLDKIRLINKFTNIRKDLTISEKKQKNLISFRRSIYAKKNIKRGDLFSNKNLICLRPFKKISSNSYFKLKSKKSKFNFKKGDLIKL